MPRSWLFVSDVDGTWTARATGALVKIVDDHALPSDANEHLISLRARYIPLAHSKRITVEQEMDWLRSTFGLYVAHGLRRQAWQQALDRVALRPGVAETYAWCAAVGLRTCAVSFGCADFIEYVAARHGLQLDAVYGTRLVHDGDAVVGYEEASLVLTEEKGRWSRRFAEAHGVPHERLIGVGDTPGDRSIGHLREHRLGIVETDEEAKKLRDMEIMGEIHVSDTFHPILEAIKRRIGLS